MMLSRRLLLLGAPALVVAPAAALAASPLLPIAPEERASLAWAEFSAAMRDVAAGCHGWQMIGGERKPFRGVAGGAYHSCALLHIEGTIERQSFIFLGRPPGEVRA